MAFLPLTDSLESGFGFAGELDLGHAVGQQVADDR
jgi:hypothetical protein